MPATISELGGKREDIPLLAANLGLKEGQTLGTFRKLSTADVETILGLCASRKGRERGHYQNLNWTPMPPQA